MEERIVSERSYKDAILLACCAAMTTGLVFVEILLPCPTWPELSRRALCAVGAMISTLLWTLAGVLYEDVYWTRDDNG